ncbi:MAG: heme biosynthesis protein HemY [Gammaproteobacteria bacterium]|nr:heme biosynthesis protein HemY [Gammaproteobacteria bacterium]
MKWLSYTLITIIIMASLTLLAMENRGYVLISARGYTIESSLVTWIVLLIIAFLSVHYTLRFLANLFQMPRGMKIWREQRRQERANQTLLDGLVKLAEGDWRRAEKDVLKHINDSRAPMLNYLAAARAAHELNEYDRRDRYLKLAGQNASVNDAGVKLTQVELQLSQHQQEQALATLRTLQLVNPQHRTVLKTLANLYLDMGEWNNLIDMIPQLRRRKVFTAGELDTLERRAYKAFLSPHPPASAKQLQDLWYRIPQHVQNHIEVLTTYIQLLLDLGNSDIVEPMIRNALKREWNSELVRLYGVIDGADPRAQLAYAEHWLEREGSDPVLLLTLGRLCLRNRLWGKARSYFEASVAANGPAETYNELAHLLETMGESELAMRYYREGLAKTSHCEHSVAAGSRLLELEHQPLQKPQTLISARK